jgi:hypothetical protein
VQRTRQPHDAREVLDSRISVELGDQGALQLRKLIARQVIAAPIEVSAARRCAHHHRRLCASGFYRVATALNLIRAIGINKESTPAHDILGAAPREISFVDRGECAAPPLGRIQRQHLWPSLVQRPMENLSVTIVAVAEELQGEPLGCRIKRPEELRRARLVVCRRSLDG